MSTRPAATPAPKRRRTLGWRGPEGAQDRARERLGWTMVLPSILVVVVVALYPLAQAVRLSFTNTRLGSTRIPRNVGFDNYQRIFQDPQFIASIWHTIVFTVASVGFETVFGMVIALVINSNFTGRGAVRTAMLIPWAIPTVVSAQMWFWMYHDIFGVINDFMVNVLHLRPEKIAWMANPSTALPAIVAVDIWKTTPFMALLLLAGLQIIPGDVYEASTIDGANKWQQFWQITLPLLRPALVVALIFRTLDAFRVFDVIYVMKGFAPETMSIAVYARQTLIDKTFLGQGSAVSIVIFLMIAVLVVIYMSLIKVEEA